MPKHARVGMVAGEASGDLLASSLIAALKGKRPDIEFAGIGGPRMAAEGFESHFPMEKLSVRGYAEALRHYREIMAIRKNLASGMLRDRPDLFIGVDSSDFNLGLERKLKDAGVPAIHYVSPAVWAWRRPAASATTAGRTSSRSTAPLRTSPGAASPIRPRPSCRRR